MRRHPSIDTSPTFSIIVPVRNNPEQLRACLQAIHASTFRSYEIIVVDDASTDATPETAEACGATVLRLKSCGGPGLARNRAASIAKGEYLLFTDSDVCIAPNTLEQFAATFAERPDLAAAFGSYDSNPPAHNLISQYKNLLHHQMHQTGNPDTHSFWSGCGAIRRSVFQKLGGFDLRYDRPCIEDIELGARLRSHGYRIALCAEIQVSHLKKWTLWNTIKTDIVHRAIPWSQMIVRARNLPNDLNLKTTQRISSILAIVFLTACLALCILDPILLFAPAIICAGVVLLDKCCRADPFPAVVRCAVLGVVALLASGIVWRLGLVALLPGCALAGIMLLNLPLLELFRRERGVSFAAAVLPLHIMYYVYSLITFGCVAFTSHLTRGGRSETVGSGSTSINEQQSSSPSSAVLPKMDLEGNRL